MADAGEAVGKGWLKWITCELGGWEWWPLALALLVALLLALPLT